MGEGSTTPAPVAELILPFRQLWDKEEEEGLIS